MRKISLKINSEELQISDRLEKRWFKDEKCCLLYYVIIGFLMWDAGAIIICEEDLGINGL